MASIDKVKSTNFNRGLEQSASYSIDDNAAQVAQNYVFHDKSATVRDGYTVYGSLPAPVVSLRKFYNKDGGNYFCAIAGGNFYNAITSGVFTSISTTPISGLINSEVFDGAVYFTDYSTPVKYFNGKLVEVAGLSSPMFRKQINDFENSAQWSNNTFGYLNSDYSYLHRDLGKQSILFSASSPVTAALFSVNGATNEKNSIIGKNFIGTQGSLTRDLSGNMHTVFISGGGTIVYAKSLDSGSTWTPTILDFPLTAENYQLINDPSIAVDSSNNLHVTAIAQYSEGYVSGFFYSKFYNLSGWGPVATFDNGAADNCDYNISVDASSNIHVFFPYLTAPRFLPQFRRIQYMSYINTSSAWTSVSLVEASHTYASVSIPYTNTNLAVDASNIRHLLWSSWSGGLCYLNSLSSNVQYITSGYLCSGQFGNIAVDVSGNRHVVFTCTSSNGTQTINYCKNNNLGTNWSPITVLTKNDAAYPQNVPNIAITENNQLQIMWTGQSVQSPVNSTIRYIYNLSGWSAVQNYEGDSASVVPMAYSYWPIVTSSAINRTNTGWAAVTQDSEMNIKYHASFDLTWDSSPSSPKGLDLTLFDANTSSDLQDLIQLFTCHDVKKDISSIVLKFTDANNFVASRELCTLSSWLSCSNDQWALTHSIPKSNFSLTSTSFNWASCDVAISMTPTSSNPQVTAYCNLDNLRMMKTPPVISSSFITSARQALFFGSTAVARTSRRFVGDFQPNGALPIPGHFETSNWIEDGLQLQGVVYSSAPLPNGTYFYKNTFVKLSPSGFEMESNPSFQTSSFSVSTNTSSWTYPMLTNIPVAPNYMGVVGRKIYRKEQAEEAFRFVYAIHDNIKTNFTDTVYQQTLGQVLEEDNNPPPQARFVKKSSQQSMYYFNLIEQGVRYPSRIRVSKPYEPYYCPLSNTYDINPDDGSEGQGMFEYSGLMYFLKDRSTSVIDANGQLSTIHQSIGCIAPYSIAVGENEVFWLSEQGIIKYRFGNWQNVSHSVKNEESLYRIQKILDRLPKEYLSNAQGIYYDGLYLLAVTDINSITNNTVLCYDVDNDVWSEFPNLNVNCWETWLGSQEGYRLFFGNNSGLVCEFFSGDYDISTPIWSSIQCKDFGIPTPTEFFRKAYLFVQDLDGQPKTLNIQPTYDFVSDPAKLDQRELTLTSGQFSLVKSDLPMGDGASFFSIGISSSGRFKINQLDIYGKSEKLR